MTNRKQKKVHRHISPTPPHPSSPLPAPPLLRTRREAGGRPSQPQPGEPAPPARPARRPSGQPVPDRSPKNALAVNAKGLPMHTSLTRPVHPPVAPVVGRRHNRHLFHHLLEDPPVVEQSHNRRRNTIYVLIRRLLTMKTKGSLSLDLLVFVVNNRRIKK